MHDYARFARWFKGFMSTNPSPEQIKQVARRLDGHYPQTAAEVRRIAARVRDRIIADGLRSVRQKAAPHVETHVEQAAAGQAQRAVGQSGPAFTFTAADVAEHGATQAPVSRALVGPEAVALLRKSLDEESKRTAIVGARAMQAGIQRRDQHESLTLEGAVYDTDIKRTKAQKERFDLAAAMERFAIEQQKVENEGKRIELERERIAAAGRNTLIVAGISAAAVLGAAYLNSKNKEG